MNYTDVGQGKVVVFIHGFCESLELWKTYEEQLSKFMRVICIDLPGYGTSTFEQVEEVSMTWLGDQVIQLLNKLEVNNLSLVGHSLGGYVSLAIAEKYLNRVDSMVLFHTTAFSDSEEKKLNRIKMAGFIDRNGLSTFMDSFVSPLFAEGNRDKCKVEIENLIADGKRSNQDAVLATIEAMRVRPDRTDVLTQFNKPILWIVGEDDVAVPLEDSLKQIELGDKTQALVLKQCGHMGMIEKPTTTLMRLTEFFA